jgi:hypothetical protein
LPVVTAPVLSREFFELSPSVMLQAVVGNALPSWGVLLAVYGAYRFVLTRIVHFVRGMAGRIAAHILVSGLAATAAALVIRPAMILFSNEVPPALGFSAACVVMTWALLLPAGIIEREADRRMAVEQRLLAVREASVRAELQALRARTQPHFLYNSLNTIASLIHDDPQLAEATVERLASVLRYVLVYSTEDAVPLGREVQMIVAYLEVQRARFGDRLRYSIAVEPGLEGLRVPPLLLQPLVENAVVHGIACKTGGGEVQLSVRARAAMIEVVVRDRGFGSGKPRQEGSGTSLRDLRRRLEILYGERSRLSTRAEVDGFIVELELPDEPVKQAAEARA